MTRLTRIILLVLSAVLLIAAFPNWNQPWCASIALVPWLLALRGVKRRGAFWWSWLVGALFFLGSIWWLVHVTVLGWLVLCAYLGSFFGIFGWIVWRISPKELEVGSWKLERKLPQVKRQENIQLLASNFQLLFVVPGVWVVLEYARSHLLSGLAWNLLGTSQASILPIAQLAHVTGVWGVSFLEVAINGVIAAALSDRSLRRVRPAVIVLAMATIGASVYGSRRLASAEPGRPIRVAIVQGNIPQEEKWDEEHQPAILAKYAALTRQAVARSPDLIVWPETSVPGFFGLEEPITAPVLRLAADVKIPLLVGAPMGRLRGTMWELTNSAALIDQQGEIAMRYDKLHLVPFGEFIPGESVAPWLRNVLPPIGNFIPGHEPVVFRLHADDPASPAFSVLVCFEDVFPELARMFVRRGAQLLITITNDAWFGDTAAAYQHAQASTMRAIELGVPMVRAANTGWSGCIDARGRWLTSVHRDDGHELFIDGVAACSVTPGAGGGLYARWGDWWVAVSAALAAIGLAPALLAAARRPPSLDDAPPSGSVR